MRCGCGKCQAIRRSEWTGGYRWAQYVRDRWFDPHLGRVTCERWRLQDLPADADGRSQCPHCRDILTASGHALREQAQMQLTL